MFLRVAVYISHKSIGFKPNQVSQKQETLKRPRCKGILTKGLNNTYHKI